MNDLRSAADATQALNDILCEVAQYDDKFFPKLAAEVKGRTRNHLAQSRSAVYPDRPDLGEHVREISPGWFLGVNIANREKVRILRAACDVMGLSFGEDLKIDLPHT